EGGEQPADDAPDKGFRQEVAKARVDGEAIPITLRLPDCLLYSRVCLNANLTKEAREQKKYDYFLLTRLPEPGKGVTGEHLVEVKAGTDSAGRTAIDFTLDQDGGNLFHDLTSK